LPVLSYTITALHKKIVGADDMAQIKYVITERFTGSKDIIGVFTDIILSEIKEKCCTDNQENGIMKPLTIPNQVVPKERS